MPSPIAAVMIHVSNISEALVWYQRAFPSGVVRTVVGYEFQYLDVDGVQLELVPADTKVASGAAGSIVYWSVPNFKQALEHLLSLGATLYRGPLEIENGRMMCQVMDPWGNCIGLRTQLN
jgi:predicted enzyme related to lactoylglutathione lyase